MRQIALLQLEASVLAFQLLENGFLEDAGFNSPTDWLRFNCHLTDKVASDRIQVGEQLAAMPASVEAMRAGEIGYGHLTVMARTAEAVGKRFEESRSCPWPGSTPWSCSVVGTIGWSTRAAGS